MFELVPSEYMRMLLKEEGFVFTDFQKAALIWNAPGQHWEKKLSELRKLAKQTEDEALRTQIEERLWYEEEAFRRFADNSDGRYVYVTVARYDVHEESVGFFAKYEMAKEYVLKQMRADVWEDANPNWFIEKQVIVRDASDLRVKNRSRWNPYMFPEKAAEKTEQFEDYDGWRTSELSIDRDGMIRFLSSGEMSREEELRVDSYNPSRFETPFFKIPFEAQMGAVVRSLANPDNDYTGYGVLMCDTKQWEKYLRNIEERQFYVDFSDIQVRVYFLTRAGNWSHEHINPLYLEIGVRPPVGEDERQKAHARAMEAFSEYWYYDSVGTSSKDAMKALEKRAIETARAYCDACLESDAQDWKGRGNWDKGVEKIEDIMG